MLKDIEVSDMPTAVALYKAFRDSDWELHDSPSFAPLYDAIHQCETD